MRMLGGAARAAEVWLGRLESAIVVLAVGAIAAIVVVNVVSRYVLHFTLSSSEEAARYLLVWLGMVGGASTFRRGLYGGVDVLVQRLPPAGRRAASLAAHAGTLAFLALLGYWAVRVVGSEWHEGARSAALRVPLWAVTSALVVGSALACVHVGVSLYRALRTASR